MPEFLLEELNLIYLYDPGNLHGLIYELRSMMAVLMPDENELRNLAQGVTVILCFSQHLFYVFRHFCFGNFVIFVLCFSPLVVVDNSLPLPVKPTDSCGI